MKFLIFTVIFTLGLTYVIADDNTLDNLPEGLSGIADKIPGLENFDTSKVPSAESAEKIFKEKCMKNGGEDAFTHATEAKAELEECIKTQVNFSTINEEMEAAKPTGDLDTVFGKYCKKTPVVLECLKKFMTALDPCLEEKERENKKMVYDLVESLANFLCHKDGDRIAMFIAEGGLECLSEKKDGIQACANATFGNKIPTEVPTELDNLPLFIIKEEQCNDFTDFEKCVVADLETCKEPTPANIVESLFKFVRRVLPCEGMGKEKKSGLKDSKNTNSSASSVIGSIFLVAGAIFLKFA